MPSTKEIGGGAEILHPVLIADLADEGARDFLEGVAIAQGRVVIPLAFAPIDGSLHVLEIHSPNREPLIVFAEPIGAPTNEGFPLRLRPIAPVVADNVETLDEPVELVRHPAAIRARSVNATTLTEQHTSALAGGVVPASPESLVGRRVADGKLEVLELVGTGGAGAVYRAVHRALRIPMAVKILHDSFQIDIEFCRRFHAEALSASKLDHVNVVRVLDFGQEPDGLFYIAMEYLDGIPLSRIVEEQGPMPLGRIVKIMSQVLAALAHAHSRGIVHRDVKPDNVVLVHGSDDDGETHERVKVCDFGIAVPAFDASSARTIAGTPHYMSPEQVSGEPLDGRSDVYACGVLLYELATGRVPFGEGDPRAIATCHVRVAPTPPSALVPDIEPGLERVILRALAKEPLDRQQNARELRSELLALTRTASSPSVPALEEPPSSSIRAATPASKRAPESSRTPSPPPSSARRDPEWIERGSDAFASVLRESTTMRAVASEIVTNTAEWLRRYAHALRHDEHRAMTEELEATLPILVATANTRVLFAVRTTLALIEAGTDARAAKAAHLLRTFNDPKLLATLAEKVVVGASDADLAARLLLQARTQAAYALYSARLKHTGTATRARFSALVTALGADALPMIRAGLAKLECHQDFPVALLLAEDLLRCTPAVYDDALGERIARFTRSSNHVLRCTAIAALARVWGARSRPVLLALAHAPDEATSAAATDALTAMLEAEARLAVAR